MKITTLKSLSEFSITNKKIEGRNALIACEYRSWKNNGSSSAQTTKLTQWIHLHSTYFLPAGCVALLEINNRNANPVAINVLYWETAAGSELLNNK